MSFNDLKLIKPLILALEKKGYQNPTLIQKNAIPHILEGKDIFGCAQTGTGKTAAFALPVLQLVSERKHIKGIKALILAPTRELALQISENFLQYGSQLKVSHATIFGGVSQHHQVNAIRNGADILVATPGRLIDLINQGHVKLNTSEILVLDEADQMLDMGFVNDVKRIIRLLPVKRQTMFFSATVSPSIMTLANSLLKSPVHIQVNPVASTAPLISQEVYYVEKEKKRSLLIHILSNKTIKHALVFTRTKRGADRVAKDLQSKGISAEAFHGDKSQGARVRALNGFKNKNVRVLVATDIAARGIDVDKLSHVINYEIPEHAENYVHRIGRTGRAGETGTALSLCAKDELSYLREINKLTKSQIKKVVEHPFS
jgi:ATP-dependent RNA helicase RhlE